MRAPRKQQQQQQQQRAGSLKAFVRVGKASDVPVPKDATAKMPVRLTRSKSAALAGIAQKKEKEPVVVETPVVSRKRKHVAEPSSPSEPKETLSSPPRKSIKKKATTINAYFSPVQRNAPAPEIAEPVAEPLVEPVVEPTKEHAIPEKVERVKQKAALDTRASALLGRLRARKRVEVDPGVRMEETRAIQEDIRARRTQAASLAQVAEAPEGASFEAGKSLSADDLRLRELRRQFVSISPATSKVLPREFRKLEELFQGLEHTVMFGGLNEKSSVVYHRVRKSVEVMAKRTFGWKELGQILRVFPESYAVQRTETTHMGRKVTSVELRPRAEGAHLAVEMENRRGEFHSRLLKLVDAAHREFLVKRGYSDDDVEAAAGGWHPSFDVESTPEISPVAMPPQMPATSSQDGAVATFDRQKLKHLLGKASDKIAASDKKPAVPLPTPTDSPVLAPILPTQPEPEPAAQTNKARPSSKAQALLERIRAKQRAREAQKQQQTSMVPASTLTMHSRLPGILEALSFMFYSERKSVLPFFYVVDKIVELKGLDKADASRHLVALAGFVPEWCAVLQEQGEVLGEDAEPAAGARIKITRSTSMQEAKARLLARISEKATI
ncbi:hypothetical protein LPJ64_002791 [Coemansia asiatica]|uniref:CDT1 Geminin-binding domain-containing protein n=1 Tax=Coemansia asiatica TaxID=1052880 RepID=A0A9W7XIZ6_9FUNG|nr:hypothetical protein LPJ64_002791 [Coemansia asiatica]